MYWLDRLSEIKKEQKKTYKDIAAACGIPLTTVEKLFSGRTKDPKLSMISAIAKYFEVSVSEFCEEFDGTEGLSESEREFLSELRSLDRFGKDRVLSTLCSEAERVKAAAKASYACIFYDFPVSAGTGEFLDESTATILNLPSPPPSGTDYILRIAGDSMNPDYNDGDLVCVKRCETLRYGEIGIFIAEGSVYMKKYSKEGLVSLNSKYPILRFFGDVRCLGKVLAKAEL